MLDTFDIIAQRDREIKELDTILEKFNIEIAMRQARIKLMDEQIQKDTEAQHEGS